jgi:hypothetical protein
MLVTSSRHPSLAFWPRLEFLWCLYTPRPRLACCPQEMSSWMRQRSDCVCVQVLRCITAVGVILLGNRKSYRQEESETATASCCLPLLLTHTVFPSTAVSFMTILKQHALPSQRRSRQLTSCLHLVVSGAVFFPQYQCHNHCVIHRACVQIRQHGGP